jgi:predicted RNase H-like nuclease
VAESETLVAGLDGCRAGWVMATVPLRATGPLRLDLVVDPRDVIGRLDSGVLAAAAIDIPIGLATGTPRRCDVEARRLLGARRSSVFPAPARSVLGATSYEDACARSALACGKKISRQLFNILPKIQQVDALVTPQCQARLFEMCPELSFALLTGAPMRANKRTAAGRAERVGALGAVFGDVDALVRRPPPGAAPDDVLDALIGAWTARRYGTEAHVQLGGELDATGLRMEVIA